MPDFSDTPPSLHFSPSSSDHDHLSTRESTPVGTPVSSLATNSRKPERDRDLYFSWRRKAAGGSGASAHHPLESTESDDLVPFPLFPSSPPERTMDLDLSPRAAATSPSGQQASNLTSALQRAGEPLGFESTNNWGAAPSAVLRANAARKESFGANMAQWGNGSKPIMMTGSNREKPRRESLAGSLVGGMSWGGVSVGSWIRDDIIMAGTSPFTLQSPSYHSSSYLPKLEANFMRDFSCCGITLPSLHDLLQHYEEAHAQRSPQPPQRQQVQNVNNQPGMVQAQQAMQQAAGVGVVPSPRPGLPQNKPIQALPQQPMQAQGGYVMPHMHDLSDLDTVDDMEMDDPLVDSGYQQSGNSMQARYRQDNQSGRVTPLNLSRLQNQGFRSSQPGTPVTQGRPLQNNPTVSSVNTPTLTSHPSQQGYPHYRGTPDSSAPGTPAELDDSVVGGFGGMSMANNPLLGTPGYSSGSDMVELCIDEPAKRLFRPSGGSKASQQGAHSRLGGGSQYGPNSEIAKRIREQQRLAGVPEPALKPDDEPKPFRCPVIGCEKAYKNQNGLKYHKSHGHNNQQLHDNADGTYSIVNPETSTPYPGTLGMEKEKPYRCEVCGKRYKNLNGLKYHRAHSAPCNPELSLGGGRALGVGGVMQGENINVAGAGLPGIGE